MPDGSRLPRMLPPQPLQQRCCWQPLLLLGGRWLAVRRSAVLRSLVSLSLLLAAGTGMGLQSLLFSHPTVLGRHCYQVKAMTPAAGIHHKVSGRRLPAVCQRVRTASRGSACYLYKMVAESRRLVVQDPQIEFSVPGVNTICSRALAHLLVDVRLQDFVVHIVACAGLLLPLSKALILSLPTQPVERQWLRAERQRRPVVQVDTAAHAAHILQNSTGSRADPVSRLAAVTTHAAAAL